MSSTKYIGLKNQGSTCYLNSLLQCLFMTPEFRRGLFQWTYDANVHGAPEDCIPFQLQKLFYRLQHPIRDVELTSPLTRSFQWEYNELIIQQDIQELCRVLFEAIEMSIATSSVYDDRTHQSFITALYQGETQSCIRCMECNNVSTRSDSFLDITLPILNPFENIHNTSVDMALSNFIKAECLEGDNKYNCVKCAKKVNAEKYIQFVTFPEVLFIQLGRFYYDFAYDQRRKIHDKVVFPLVLNLNKYKGTYNNGNSSSSSNVSDDSDVVNANVDEQVEQCLKDGNDVYTLYGIVIQSGNANGGHYYAYIRSFEDDKWYCFNDAKVSEINVSDIANVFGVDSSNSNTTSTHTSTTAYCLMYRRATSLHKLTINDMCVNDELQQQLREENELIIKEEIERKAKMNRINVNVYYCCCDANNNGNETAQKKVIQTQKVFTLLQFKEQICKEFDINNNNNNTTRAFKLREYDALNKKKLEYVNAGDNDTLEQAYICGYKNYVIQFADENGEYVEYDSSLIEVCVYDYKDNESSINEGKELVSRKVVVSNRKTMYDLSNAICNDELLSKGLTSLIVVKKVNFGFDVKYVHIERNVLCDKTSPIYLNSILDKTELYVELSDGDGDGNDVSLEQSKWMKYFKQQDTKVKITFNSPTTTTTTNTATTIYASKYDTMNQIKTRICEIINADPNTIVLHKSNAKGTEITDLHEEVNVYCGSNTEMHIHLRLGTPLKPNELKITLYHCTLCTTKFNFFPYTITEVSTLIINASSTFNELKPLFINELINKRIIPEPQQQQLHNNNNNNILIRKYAHDKPTTIYPANISLKTANIANNAKLLIQILNNDNNSDSSSSSSSNSIIYDDSLSRINNNNNNNSATYEEGNEIEISMRYFDSERWLITAPIEVVVQYNESIKNIRDVIMKHYGKYIKSVEHVQVLKLVNGYNMYLDSIVDIEFTDVDDVVESSVDKYPFFIKGDGCMLIVRDRSKRSKGEVTQEIKEKYFKPNVGMIPVPPVLVTQGKGSVVKEMVKMLENKGYDPVESLKRNKERSKAKEKGVVIKVKMYNNDDKEDTKDENKSNTTTTTTYNNNDNKNNVGVGVAKDNNNDDNVLLCNVKQSNDNEIFSDILFDNDNDNDIEPII